METKISLASVHQDSEVSLCSVHLSKRIIQFTRNFNDAFILAAQIIDYQVCKIIESQRVINKLSKRRNTMKPWEMEFKVFII